MLNALVHASSSSSRTFDGSKSRRRWTSRISPSCLGTALAIALSIGSNRAAAEVVAAPPDGQNQALDQERVGAALQVEVAARLARPNSDWKQEARATDEPDSLRPTSIGSPSIHQNVQAKFRHSGISWNHQLDVPTLADHRRRRANAPLPVKFGDHLRLGERFAFDVTYSGNPAGMAEIAVTGIEADPRGPIPGAAPVIRVEGTVRTSGVLAMLAAVTDHMTTWLDSETGVSMRNVNVIDQSGIGVTYKHRETRTEYHGLGRARIVDTRDRKVRKVNRIAPIDTFDPIAAIVWVRALELAPGERKQVHALDGSVILRVDVINRGRSQMKPMPSLAQGLGIGQENVELYEGTLTRVDRHDEAIAGKRNFNFRAWVANTSPRILLGLESDMWIGIVRIRLSHYDPPKPEPASPPPPPSPASP
jgi:hypothetical protein